MGILEKSNPLGNTENENRNAKMLGISKLHSHFHFRISFPHFRISFFEFRFPHFEFGFPHFPLLLPFEVQVNCRFAELPTTRRESEAFQTRSHPVRRSRLESALDPGAIRRRQNGSGRLARSGGYTETHHNPSDSLVLFRYCTRGSEERRAAAPGAPDSVASHDSRSVSGAVFDLDRDGNT